MAWEPMLGHIEDEISKNKGKKSTMGFNQD
jgi:hypothetical protein